MDFNRAYIMRPEDRNPGWRVIDADGKILGRLATEITDALRGKDTPHYTPHTDTGSYVVVINADKIKLTANKMDTKIYASYSGWIGGLKERTARQVWQKDPTDLIRRAVTGMMPKNRLSGQFLSKLKLYVGDQHPHKGQFEGQAKRLAQAGKPKVAKTAKAPKAAPKPRKKVAAE
jgi:large subunit ribosomal protein L13